MVNQTEYLRHEDAGAVHLLTDFAHCHIVDVLLLGDFDKVSVT